jgi:hypothetical protein
MLNILGHITKNTSSFNAQPEQQRGSNIIRYDKLVYDSTMQQGFAQKSWQDNKNTTNVI